MSKVKLPLLLVLLCGMFILGFTWSDLQHGRSPEAEPWKALIGTNKPKSGLSPSKVFKTAFDDIVDNYPKPVDRKDLKYAGIEGMMASLGDPHTNFFVPKVAQAFSDETSGEFVGIGARLSPDPSGAKVVVVFENSPAAKAGLKVGDIITGVEGKQVTGIAVEDIVTKIRGKDGTLVKFRVVRPGVDQPLNLVARRARLTLPTVEGKVLDGTNIGYVGILSFSEPTASQFDSEIRKLERQKIQGLVIDLRGNPGGLLPITVDMLSRFFDHKLVVRTVGKAGKLEEFLTNRDETKSWLYPIVVLMNEDSASASEIFAGTLKAYGAATLVGKHSYGKASVQNAFGLSDETIAKITVAKYILPNGLDISRKVDEDGGYVIGGLKPDVEVDMDPDKPVKADDWRTDAQIAKAVEVVRQKSNRN